MNQTEAKQLLTTFIDKQRSLSFSELAQRAGESSTTEVLSSSGKKYQISLQIFWEGKNIRVLAAIDDRGISVFFPNAISFAVAADGKLVEE